MATVNATPSVAVVSLNRAAGVATIAAGQIATGAAPATGDEDGDVVSFTVQVGDRACPAASARVAEVVGAVRAAGTARHPFVAPTAEGGGAASALPAAGATGTDLERLARRDGHGCAHRGTEPAQPRVVEFATCIAQVTTGAAGRMNLD